MGKRIVGLDLGTKTLGIAISDSLNLIATGVETFYFETKHYTLALNHLTTLTSKYEIGLFVIGLPYHMSGEISERATSTILFAKKLEALTKIKVVFSDERLTSVVANKRLLEADISRNKRKKVIDEMAAREILQNYLDMHKFKEDMLNG